MKMGNYLLKSLFGKYLLDDNKIKSASYDNDKGFGLRAVNEDVIKFFHSSELNEASIKKALKSISHSKHKPLPEKITQKQTRDYIKLQSIHLIVLKKSDCWKRLMITQENLSKR